MAEPASESIVVSDFLLRMITGLLGGILIGLERERAQFSGVKPRRRKESSIPGLRSFGLISLFGALSSYIASEFREIVAGAETLMPLALVSLLLFVAFYAYIRMIKQEILGVTTYIVMLLAFLVGVLAGIGFILEAASTSVLVTMILALKSPAVKLAQSIEYRELLAILEVAAMFLVIGPIVLRLSEIAGFSSLYKVYLFFALVLALSLTSYIMARAWGVKGLAYAAILGSLVNSEAMIGSVTQAIKSLKEFSGRASLLGKLTAIIISVMQARSSLIALIALYIFTGYDVVSSIALYLLGLILVSIAILGSLSGIGGEGVDISKSLAVASPINWGTAARAAVAYAVLTLAANIIAGRGFEAAVAVIGLVGGLVNATATILSVASVASVLDPCIASASILGAIFTASLNKVFYADLKGLNKAEVSVLARTVVLLALVPGGFMALSYVFCP
ncbi:MAG: DUF4010 domain-containing protein [Desulfurococcales archaeon]|nr:DUF4010 domain-containing protein [Desulfurococcales archaeon]